MNVYLQLDLLVLALPLVLSFDRKVAFWRKWPQVLAAIVGVLVVFGAWDVWKTAAEVWGFNPRYAGDVRVLGLPPGEWLFFVVVPYACLFILECVRAYFRDRTWHIPRWTVGATAGVFTVLACCCRGLTYTGTVFLSVAVAVMLLEWGAPTTLRSRCFWVAMAVTYLPFLIANGVLTGLPIVWYDDVHILAIRVGSIPLEDFFYSFSMLTLAVVIHDRVGRWRGVA
ncbi:MAG: lycopene cyclase domain-containing protein [Kiritimatiellia bacterium]|jgi:lycopene cyclase domain-containing protein|nr:lycopene cyclase domain-containing protein [Kiritimatiellia bacterium]